VTQLRRFAASIVLSTVVFVVLLGAAPVARETLTAGYALALAGIALAGLTSAIGEARSREASQFEHELLRTRTPPTRPAELVRMERELVLASSSAGHFHNRLQPLLREIASARGAAFVESPRPADPVAPGVPLRKIASMLDELERS
jgi:hypothetical protein